MEAATPSCDHVVVKCREEIRNMEEENLMMVTAIGSEGGLFGSQGLIKDGEMRKAYRTG